MPEICRVLSLGHLRNSPVNKPVNKIQKLGFWGLGGSQMQTYATKGKDIEKKWYVVDATDRILGRLASEISRLLMGKHKPYITRHLDVGDFVIVINAKKVRLTGKKLEQKYYFRHTGYPGGVKMVRLDKMLSEKPEKVIRHAVRGMLPHNSLGRHQLKKMKVYAGPDHPHEAQKPELLEI